MASDHAYTSLVESDIGFWTISANDEAVISITHSSFKPEINELDSRISLTAAKQIDEYFKGNYEPYSLFFKTVWHALVGIPFGRSMSYSELAKKIGNPKAVRAVGMANAKNPFPIVVPCHRIIGKNQDLTGYAYGLKVKRWLLEHEGVLAIQGSLF